MDNSCGTSLPTYAVEALRLHAACRVSADRPASSTVSAVNCSQAVWGKCIDALDGLTVAPQTFGHYVHFNYLPLERFLVRPNEVPDGVVLLSCDAGSYMQSRRRIVECLNLLALRPWVSVVPVCSDEQVLEHVLQDLFPALPVHLQEQAPSSDFYLALSVLLQVTVGTVDVGSSAPLAKT